MSLGLARKILLVCVLPAALAFGQTHNFHIDRRESPDQPVKHMLIHGVLDGRTGFYILLPAPELWKGRLMHFLGGGMGGDDDSGMRNGASAYALANGAIYVESSQGHMGPSYTTPGDTPAELAYAASYAVVQYARERAVEVYGKKPAHSYVFGGSGGGFRSSDMLERYPDIYDGAAPSLGGGTLEPLFDAHSLYEEMRPVLQSKAAAIDDIYRPGSSANVSDAIKSKTQLRALDTLLKAGFPRNSLFMMQPSPVTVSLLDYIRYQVDPGYFDDFAKHCKDCKGKVVEGIEGAVKEADAKTRRLSTDLSRPDDELFGYTLVFTSGALKGHVHTVLRNAKQDLILSPHGPGIEGLQPGDRFTLSNRDLLAWRELHRSPKPAEMRRVLEESDRPVGKVRGKMIIMFGADDYNVWPVLGVRYHEQVKKALGSTVDNHFRIHFIEHGVHGGASANALDRQVPDGFVMYKAMDDVMAWVERNVAPPDSTQYSLDEDNQLVLPPTASQRRGYQPVVALKADGESEGEDIKAGSQVRFEVEAEDPNGQIVLAEMDFDGDNKFDESKPQQATKVNVQFQHRYDRPGTYFATVRVTNSTTVLGAPGHGIQNLSSVRVVVH